MISTRELFKPINEDAGLTVAGLGAVLFGLFKTAQTHTKANQLENLLLKNYDDDFLKLKLTSDISVNSLFSGFTVRGNLLKRMVNRNDVVLVNNMGTARLLKQYFPQFPIFKHLFTDKRLKYNSGDEFFKDHKELFKLFGELRSRTSITWDGALKSFLTLGISSNIPKDSLDEGVQANIFYLALFFRQLALNKDDIGALVFDFEQIQVRHQR